MSPLPTSSEAKSGPDAPPAGRTPASRTPASRTPASRTPAGRIPAWVRALLALSLTCVATLVTMVLWEFTDEADLPPRNTAGASASAAAPALLAQQRERGAYLVKVGNCAACHTARGGQPFAGGHSIETPFGAVFAGNLTPDRQHGLGSWTSADFWRAMHHGKSKDGRLLYPAFPYNNTTAVTRADSDAIFAHLQSLPAVAQPNRAHAVGFPYNTQLALAAWRVLFFKPQVFTPEPERDAEWNRGAYLVRGLGHCNACHAARNALGGVASHDLGGGVIPLQNWYAPSLVDPGEAGVQNWPKTQVVALLKHGVAPQGSVIGPMAEVVFKSTQHMTEADLGAIATFLQALPIARAAAPQAPKPSAAAQTRLATGRQVYADQCLRCHGDQGQGMRNAANPELWAWPPLAGNRAVTMARSTNLVRIVTQGGFAPSTPGNPQPHGMPAYGQFLSDEEVAAVLSYIRSSWGNQAAPVSALDVLRSR